MNYHPPLYPDTYVRYLGEAGFSPSTEASNGKPHSALCQPCPRGKFANGRGSKSCSNCDVGRFNNITGQKSCPLCGIGKYNPKSDDNAEDHYECAECAIGELAKATRDGCESCQPGQYVLNETCAKCQKVSKVVGCGITFSLLLT